MQQEYGKKIHKIRIGVNTQMQVWESKRRVLSSKQDRPGLYQMESRTGLFIG